ncbi:MAG TPA: SDR family oxidoreductase [Chloroflexota bacterium]|jgi:1,1a-dihydroxy-1-hydro-9-fluorenone dehydrogenase|nr:SDR family oxidoreductase [Chloroflexota bacterium]
MEIPLNLRDRVVVITGAARGMGAAYTRGFLAEGARVVATDRHWTGSEEFRDELSSNDRSLALDMDLTSDEQIDAAFSTTLEKFGTADVLVNNAGMRQRDLFPPHGRVSTLETSDEDFFRMYNVNVFGTLRVIRRFIRPMIEQKRGSIISVVSSGMIINSTGGAYTALRPDSREQPYMSSKAALANMTCYLADEVREHNVAANVVVPGHTRTTGFDEQNRARLERGARLGPRPMVPEHIVPIVMYLASQDASTVTGKIFDVMTWNVEHGLGGAERWADMTVERELLANPG